MENLEKTEVGHGNKAKGLRHYVPDYNHFDHANQKLLAIKFGACQTFTPPLE